MRSSVISQRRGHEGWFDSMAVPIARGMTGTASLLGEIRERIARAAKAAKRNPGDVTLVAVTKQRSVAEIESLISAGVTDFGENRVAEALQKWGGLREAHHHVRLHMIGQLQSNKAAEAVRLFDVIHSLDRRSLLDALVKAGTAAGRYPTVFVQVNIGGEAQKGGVAIDRLPVLLDEVRASPLQLAGLMAMPPLDQQPGPYFALAAELARRHGVEGLSMGMSSDYEAAVMLGATAVRIGSALFGE
jgi:pyridoxal phosphate enzyme (YggS family)